jgi:putative MATE family efflux protein
MHHYIAARAERSRVSRALDGSQAAGRGGGSQRGALDWRLLSVTAGPWDNERNVNRNLIVMSSEAAPAQATAGVAILDEAHLSRSVVRMAWPVVVQQVSFTMVQLVDTLLVGHLGKDALAGVGLASIVYWIPQAGVFAVGVGAIAVVARNLGAGQRERASITAAMALMMGLTWGVLLALLMALAADPVLRVMGAEPAARSEGVTWMRAASIGFPLTAMLYAGNASLQGAGDTRTPMIIMLFVNLVNAVVAYTLINGPGPFPELKVLGSGLGATSAGISGAVLVLLAFAAGRGGLELRPLVMLRPDPSEIKRVLNVGLPAGVENLQFYLAFLVYTRIIASLGSTALAAHRVTLSIEGLAFNPGFALGVASAALVGQSLGAQRPDLAERSAKVALGWAAVLMTSMGVILMLFGEPITSLFISGEDADEVVDIGRRLLFIFAFALPAMAASSALAGALRGAGDTRAVMAIGVFGVWVVRLLPAYLLAIVLGLDAPGAWLAAVLDINSRGLLVWLRFRRGKWKTLEV